MAKHFLRTVRNDLLLVVIGAVLGSIALLLAHLLPVGPMQEHVYWSLPMIEKEFEDEVVVTGYRSTLTGNFTDCLMLEYAVYEPKEHSVPEQILHMYRSESCGSEGNWWPGHSLKDYLENTPQPREVEYARYWHGYLVVLKPLLLLTSFNTIRLLNSALQLWLVGCIVMAFCRKNAMSLAKGFLVSVPFLFFVSTYASLSLSICFYIMALSLLIQLRFDPLFCNKNWYLFFFLAVGMATSYFDLLTYPLVTLVFPLCVYIYLHGEKIGSDLQKVGQYSLQWFAGYMGLWASKWILADWFTGSSIVQDAVSTLMTRTGSAAGYSRMIGFISVLQKNIHPYGNWCYVILAAIALVMLLSQMPKQRIRLRSLQKAVPYMFLALYPLIWFFVAQNHSEQHWQFTCRIFACSVFAAYAGCERIKDGSIL